MHRKKSADSWDAPASGTSASSDTATASEAAAADLGDASSSRLLTASSSGNGEKNAPGIRLTHLCKAYDGKPVLQDFCALLPYGQTTAVMAPSGAGKTTLLRLLLGLEQPDSGQIEGLDGLRPAAVFQEDRLCASLTADANIRLITPSLTRAEALAAMEEIGLSDCGDQPVSEFSGGMRRRVALLRALLSDCDVLFLDEPFKGLDDTSKALVMEDTRRRAKGRTVLLVTHDLSEAQALGARVIHIGTNCAEGNRTETE
ncbi:MAG: ATP-binding cassette domain-containing protein [Eubacteriales bacterium]|nr:ATP-binding cassette domain-containing protein [Eubacteriales bacterium]